MTHPATPHSFRSILKTSSLIGGASVFNILIGMVRTKFVAILLGPNGVGLLGMYGQITGLVGNVTRLGIGSSGVRQVAEAVGSHDEDRIARTVITLRRTAWLTGGLGLLVMVVFCIPISQATFSNSDHSWSIALLGITLLAGAIAGGQGCIINGTRRIGDLAKISIIGAINGTLISIPCFYFWGTKGIVPSLILSALASLATSWWYARRVPVKSIALTLRESSSEARQLFLLGISFMGGGLVTSLAGYLINVIMLRQFGIADVGIYRAAFNLSGILVGFVLGAMGADYYPRLTAVSDDNTSIHRMVNEQSQISILLALPGLAAMMIFAPLIINIFYSAAFSSAVPILRWCILGILGRVFSWPMGYILLAKGKGRLFFIFELITSILHLSFVYIFCKKMGLIGSGVAFMSLYIVCSIWLLFIMRRLVGATWNWNTLKLVLTATLAIIFLMLNSTLNHHHIIAWSINLTVLLGITWFCLKQLSKQSNIGLKAILAKFKK